MLSGGPFAPEFINEFLTTGFGMITAPQTTKRRLDGIFQKGKNFFEADLQEKMLSRLPLDTGYRPHGIEYSAASSRPDQMESFSVNHRLTTAEGSLSNKAATDLRNEMLKVFDEFEFMVEDLTRTLAGVLVERSMSTPCEYINEVHEDGCLMTAISVTGPGLEVKAANGSFVPIQPVEQLLFMAGEILHLLTGGEIPIVYHRVRPEPALEDRMSLLFFADMNPNLCAPWISNHVNADVDIGERVLKNSTRYGLQEWKIQA
jgi:isopenicillin N synthase-like dioxygenase